MYFNFNIEPKLYFIVESPCYHSNILFLLVCCHRFCRRGELHKVVDTIWSRYGVGSMTHQSARTEITYSKSKCSHRVVLVSAR